MSLFLMAEKYSIVYMYHNFMIHSSAVGHWVISRAWLLWTVLWWTSVYRCLCFIQTYIPLGISYTRFWPSTVKKIKHQKGFQTEQFFNTCVALHSSLGVLSSVVFK
jgi:hypothetical protein